MGLPLIPSHNEKDGLEVDDINSSDSDHETYIEEENDTSLQSHVFSSTFHTSYIS